MGQSREDTIEDCQALCESTEGCVAFMYGGQTTVHQSKKCELSSSATPNNSWGSNFRFCQMITEEPTLSPSMEPTLSPTQDPTQAPTYLSVSDYALVTDAISCEAAGMETITTTSQCAAAVSALNLADQLDASDVKVSKYHDRKNGCIWHGVHSEANLISGGARQDKACNYRGYAGCVCASPKFTLVDDATSCEAVGMMTITTTSQCAAAVSALKLADNLDVSDVKVSKYHDRKDGCIWHGIHSEANLISGGARQDKPCNYRGYTGCVCANPNTAFVKGPKTGCEPGFVQPTSAEDCKEIAVANGIRYWGGKGHSSGADPRGCIFRTPDQDVYFNTHSTGSTNRGDRQTVCVEVFVQGPKTGCEPGYHQPQTAEECEAIAHSGNIRYWGGAGHSSGADPRGCIYRTPDKDVYFNTHETGSTNRGDRRTVCVRDN